MQPIFLFSLPRSGSTLVQRVLASHPDVTTCSEPWFLLPLIYTLRDEGIYAEYNHHTLTSAVDDLCRQLPGGESHYRSEIRSFALRLYSSLSPDGDARYFIDKTPRYHLIVDDLFATFPDGRFLFLWRNPPAVISSMVETWQKGRWTLHPYHVDLLQGLPNLVESFSRHQNRACALRYEQLVSGDASAWSPAYEYLGLDFDESAIARFAEVELHGRMGDPRGSRSVSLAAGPPDKWHKTFHNAFRKSWCLKYLRWLGPDRLGLMGYDLASLLREVEGIQTSATDLGPDMLRASYGWAVQRIRAMAVTGHEAFGDGLARAWTAVMDR
jgi:Sulfotransferase family